MKAAGFARSVDNGSLLHLHTANKQENTEED
jgi:hypothetical protein